MKLNGIRAEVKVMRHCTERKEKNTLLFLTDYVQYLGHSHDKPWETGLTVTTHCNSDGQDLLASLHRN